MSEEELRERWYRDALLLGAIGHRFEETAIPTVVVRLPQVLAARAAEAWDRDDGSGPLGPEDAGSATRWWSSWAPT